MNNFYLLPFVQKQDNVHGIIVIFSVNLPMVSIYKFCKKRNFDPTTWRTLRTTSKWRSTQKIRATEHFIKDEITRRVDILWRISKKIAKKLKMKSQERKNLIYLKTFQKFTFLGPITSLLTFLQFSQNCTWLYQFWSFRLLWNFL